MENHLTLEQDIKHLNDRNHLCLIYEKDPIEQMHSFIPFIKQGLENNEQFIYIADDLTVKQLYHILKINEIAVDKEINKGALKLWTRN
ncbi:MAG: MEDS domain-containing protein [Ignavibacteria bacterium]|nr:MEDS domain-containing protein [Ignavibacteria bacterium]